MLEDLSEETAGGTKNCFVTLYLLLITQSQCYIRELVILQKSLENGLGRVFVVVLGEKEGLLHGGPGHPQLSRDNN